MTTVRITDAGGNKPTFVQWDVDRVLYISGVASQPCLHFANAELKRAIVVQAEEVNGKWECKVPNFILQFACPMVVSVFVQPDEGRTVATAVYEVKPKLKPQDYSYTENIGYINWVDKSEEVQALIETIQGMLDRGELKGDPFTYDDFTEEQLAALKGDPGDDGVSPTVTTEVTYYGNKVTFTDADGDHTIIVLDGMTATVKSALLNLFQHVAYVDDQGQTYYDALYDAFNPVLNVDYITVVFDPGTAVIYNTYELAQLRPYLTVTAHYDDGTSATVDTYTLSGTLAAGTDVITVTYGGKSAIFTVTVVEWLVSISAVFTQTSPIFDTDSIDTIGQYLVVTATYADSTTATVSDYTLSGALTTGTSTFTVSYGGKTDTFNVTVTAGYVQDNLLAYWDGIDNTGEGHSSAATKWTDIVNGYELPLYETTNTTWGDDALLLSGANTEGVKTGDPLWSAVENCTIEIVLVPTEERLETVATFDTSATASSGYYQSRRVTLFSADNTIAFIGDSGYTYTNPESDITDIRKLAATYTDFTVNSAYANGTALSLSANTHSLRPKSRDFWIATCDMGKATGYPYKGKIHAIRVYSKNLTSSELDQNLAYDNYRYALGLSD